MNLCFHHQTCHIKLNRTNHVIKHTETFCLILNNRVVLSIATKSNRVTQLIEGINMICPLVIYNS